MKIVVKGKQDSLSESVHYKAEGGFGKVYVKGTTAYKIYLDPTKMIPAGKIRELSQIQLPNVFAPQDIIYDLHGREIGFTMKALDKNEYLIKLFSKKFRRLNSITPEMVIHLVKRLQVTMAALHQKQILVVDCNVMNFLVAALFDETFFIDVDSYQTPSYKTNIIMTTFMDRKMKSKLGFTEFSDWFSFALVAFNLYTGTHPYAGICDKYGGEDRVDRMLDDNVSVLGADAKLPGGTQDLSVIPKSHMDWFKRLFVDGERSIPPMPDAIAVIAAPVAKLIAGTEKFLVTLLETFAADLQGVMVSNGSRFYLTETAVFQEKTEYLKFSSTGKKRGIVAVKGGSFVLVEYDKYSGTVLFANSGKTIIGRIAADAFSVENGCVYTITNGNSNLVENSFIQMANGVIHVTQVVGNTFAPTGKMYQGVAFQDVLGKAFAVIPFDAGYAMSIPLPELDGHRVIDAKYQKQFLVVFTEHGGKYTRFVFHFPKRQSSEHTVRSTVEPTVDTVSFTVLEKGLCIMTIRDEKIEAFFTNAAVKTVDKPPFDSEDQLYHEGDTLMVIKDTKLYKIALK